MLMKNIIHFSDNETNLVYEIINRLRAENKIKEILQIENNKNALQQIANAISLYPSILKEQHLGTTKRSVETLVHSLCEEEKIDLRLHMPTKALLGNAFLIAKINFFYMLMYTTSEIPDFGNTNKTLIKIMTNHVFTLTAEEVFLSIIEDKKVKKEIKIKAGYLLANIWEYRFDHGVREFAPILSNIWRARGTLVPTYGTMLGFSELFKISEKIEPAFFEFLQSEDLSDEEIHAIEEFIFDLSFEETKLIKERMLQKSKHVISKSDVNEILGDNRAYPHYNTNDPRELYRSFTDRKANSKHRAKSNFDGPQKTIEEYLMCYLLAKKDLANIEAPDNKNS
jgi:hypothetical protein